MPDKEDHLLRLLRRIESSLADTHGTIIASVVQKTIRRILDGTDVQLALEELYSVHGFDEFALRLMWLSEHGMQGLEAPGMAQREIETLIGLLREVTAEPEPVKPKQQPPPVVDDEAHDLFYEALRKFGRTIEEFKRKSFDQATFRGIEQDLLDRILDQTVVLQQTAAAVGREDVVRLAIVVTNFVHYVSERGLLQDVRIVNILDNMNLSLQGSRDAEPESLDALQQTVEMLQNPKILLD